MHRRTFFALRNNMECGQQSPTKYPEVFIMCNNNNGLCGCFGGNNWWWIIILLLIFCNCGCGNNNWNTCERNDCGCC